jgi:diguanylate cyclase (GGDEF)-like protein
VVIEITEHTPVPDYASLRSTLDDLRQAGLEIAIDDLGSGYSGLRQWSELHPQYVKIDAHFVRDVNNCSKKRQFIHSIVEIARALGSRVVAEGIETHAELETILALGVHYGQGYLLGRPRKKPATVNMPDWRDTARPQPPRTTQTVSAILKYTPAIEADTSVAEVMERFDRRPGLRCLVVCRDGKPQGLVTRTHLTSVFASRYGRDLFSRRPVHTVMQTELICVAARTPLDELSERLTREYEYLPEQDLVITDGEGGFMGTASFTDLLRAITELQIRSARYANPLTQLPGSVPLNERIDELLASGAAFRLAYCDLDNFKPFNDTYGYARGDEVLRSLATILQDEAGSEDLVGHVGGDDFILVLRSPDWADRCQRMLERFAAGAPDFYDTEHRTEHGIHAENRRGEVSFHPFLSVSIGITSAEPFEHSSHMEIATAATEVKQQAKKIAGNSLFLDRRSKASMTEALRVSQTGS